MQDLEKESRPGCKVCILKILFLCFYFYWLALFIIFHIGNNNSDEEKLQKFSNHKLKHILQVFKLLCRTGCQFWQSRMLLKFLNIGKN